MKLFTCLTPSHAEMYDKHFAPSVALSGLEMQPPRTLPEQSSCDYDTPGFRKSCEGKIDYLLEVLEHETQPFVFSDVDVRFYGRVVEDLEQLRWGKQVVYQSDGPGWACSGFMVIEPCDWTRQFFYDVRKAMDQQNIMDQDAVHFVLRARGLDADLLPERYWTVGQTGKHWTPGTLVNPPKDLLTHHANWTVGVPNKLKLLERVLKRQREHAEQRPVIFFETSTHHTFDTAIETSIAAEKREHVWHHPMPLALVLQFWEGDKRKAMELAQLLADIEPEPRDDVVFVFAPQEGTVFDQAMCETLVKVGLKFSYFRMVTKVDLKKKYPGICFDPWASAVQQLSDNYFDGIYTTHSAFFFEPDGCPMRSNWIDRLKEAHAATMAHDKSITGAHMRENEHINGSLVMHLPLWERCPDLHRCPAFEPWDIFHGATLVRESHPTNVIANMFGIHVEEDLFLWLGREAAWLTSVKDGSHHALARKLIVEGNCKWKL